MKKYYILLIILSVTFGFCFVQSITAFLLWNDSNLAAIQLCVALGALLLLVVLLYSKHGKREITLADNLSLRLQNFRLRLSIHWNRFRLNKLKKNAVTK